MQLFLKRTLLQQTLTAWLAIVLPIVLAITQLSFSPVMAQTAPDIEPPIIEIEAVLEADANDTQAFTALVADDQTLKDVTLYHRRAGQQPFDRVEMLPLGTIGYYGIELSTDPSDERTIEYYVQARDLGGNRTINGYAFKPHQRIINASAVVAQSITPEQPVVQAAITTPEITPEPTQNLNRKKWWGIGLAVLVGALAISSSSGSSGSSDDPSRTQLTINLPLPQ